MKFTNYLLAIPLLLMIACSKDTEPKTDKGLDGAPAGAVLKSEVDVLDEDLIKCVIDVFIVNERGNVIENLGNDNFSIEDNSYYLDYEIKGLSGSNSSSSGAYSATLLLDQSGSIEDTDPDDLRIEASKIFMRFLGGSDEAALASFSGSSSTILSDFTQDTVDFFEELDKLAYTEYGSTPLYEATNDMVDFTVDEGANNNKAVLLFTDGKPSYSTPRLADVLENANDNNVQIYTIGLSNGVDQELLAEIANETDGAFMWAEDVKQLLCLFGNLGDLLHGGAYYYNLEFEVKTSSIYYSGNTYSDYIVVELEDGTEIKIPFSYTIP